MKVKEIKVGKKVTVGLPDFSSITLEYSIVAVSNEPHKLFAHVDSILQKEVDTALQKWGVKKKVRIC